MRKVLVIGGDSRSDRIAQALDGSPHVGEIHITPANAGAYVRRRWRKKIVAHRIPENSAQKIFDLAAGEKFDLAVIGPEGPQVAGMADQLRRAGCPVFGADREIAAVEGSKARGKMIMERARVLTSPYRVFRSARRARAYLQQRPGPVVVKADGLTRGQGAFVCDSTEEALGAVDALMTDAAKPGGLYGRAGRTVVIEERLYGREFTIHAFCGGAGRVISPVSEDKKRLRDNDDGPNTGGMGAILRPPWITKKDIDAATGAVDRTLKVLRQESRNIGCAVYPGQLVERGTGAVYTLEYNMRLGSPDGAEVLFPVLGSDPFELLYGCATGTLDPSSVFWRDDLCCVSVVLAPSEYPNQGSGNRIIGLADAEQVAGVTVSYGGVRYEDGELYNHGGRVLVITAVGTTIAEARNRVYRAISHIYFKGMQFRTDVAAAYV